MACAVLNDFELKLVYNALRGSNHPLSRRLYDYLPEFPKVNISEFEEILGKGIQTNVNGKTIKIGSAVFVGYSDKNILKQTNVYVSIDDVYTGKFIFDNQYRNGLETLFIKLNKK